MNTTAMKEAKEFAKLSGGFRASRVILTANTLGVFENIGKGHTAPEVAKVLKTDARATEILLDAVTALGLLKKSGGIYRLTVTAKRFLLPDSPFYQGDMLRHAAELWKGWSGLDDVVRTGKPNRAGDRNHDVFIRAMHNNAVMRAGKVIGALDLRGVSRALDLGGGPGTYSIVMAKRGIDVTLFDLPNTLEVARGTIRRSGAERVVFQGGNFHIDDIGGPYDLVFASQVLHSSSSVVNRALLAKAHAALVPGGTMAIHEFTLAENHAGPVPGALFSVNMLVNTEGGRSYSPREMKGWLKEAGFGRMDVKDLGDTVLVTGRKKRR
jgi:SAM-dependent methyltransferase